MGDEGWGPSSPPLLISVRSDGKGNRVSVNCGVANWQLTRRMLREIGDHLAPYVLGLRDAVVFELSPSSVGLLSGLWDQSTDDVLVFLQRVRAFTKSDNDRPWREGREAQACAVLLATLLVSCPSLGYLLDLGAAKTRANGDMRTGLEVFLTWTHPCTRRHDKPRVQCAEQITWEFLHETSAQTLPDPAPSR